MRMRYFASKILRSIGAIVGNGAMSPVVPETFYLLVENADRFITESGDGLIQE